MDKADINQLRISAKQILDSRPPFLPSALDMARAVLVIANEWDEQQARIMQFENAARDIAENWHTHGDFATREDVLNCAKCHGLIKLNTLLDESGSDDGADDEDDESDG